MTIFSYTMNMDREITNNKNEIKNFLSNEANVDIQLTRDTAAQNILREKCPEFFLVQIQENTDQKKTLYLDTFHAVIILIWCNL